MAKEIEALEKAIEIAKLEIFLSEKIEEIKLEVEKYQDTFSMVDGGLVLSVNLMGANKINLIAGSSDGVKNSLKSLIKCYKEAVK